MIRNSSRNSRKHDGPSHKRMHASASQTLYPGNEAARGTPGTGEDICPQSQGSGRIDGSACPNCGGSGMISRGIGGAQMRKARARRCGDARSGKCHADAPLLAPDNVALLTRIAGQYIQRDFVWDARGASNFERRPRRGYVANRAIDSPAVELDRSGLEYPLPRLCASLIHSIALDLKA